MASNRNENGYRPYTPDAFDDPPEGPVGVHRGPRSLAVRVIPFGIVIVLAILCGVGAWTIFSGSKFPWQRVQMSSSQVVRTQSTTKKPVKESPKTDSSSSKATASASAQPSTTPSTSQPVTPAPVTNKAAAVRVVNGTNTAGYAASKKQLLVANGYSNVTAANPAGQLPTSSVVWYQDAKDKATAEDIARTLGITNVQQSTATGAEIVAVLLN